MTGMGLGSLMSPCVADDGKLWSPPLVLTLNSDRNTGSAALQPSEMRAVVPASEATVPVIFQERIVGIGGRVNSTALLVVERVMLPVKWRATMPWGRSVSEMPAMFRSFLLAN